MTRQRLGQHFLGDPAWQERIFHTLPKAGDETWIEIGPGHGELTRLLAADGRRVIAIEADPGLAEGLRRQIRSEREKWPRVEVIEGDVLEQDLSKLAGGSFRAYGNLPYYITSPILHRLFDCADHILSIHIVIQLEVAERIVSAPGHREYGYLSTACQFYGRPRISLKIRPGAFRPPPKVHSALVEMELPGERAELNLGGVTREKDFLKFVQACFEQKRKTLRNNLRGMGADVQAHSALEAAGLRPDARAEQLTLTQFASLFAFLQK